MKLNCPYCGTSSFVPDLLALGVPRELRCQQCRTEIPLVLEPVEGAPTRAELFDGRYEKLGPTTDSGLGRVCPAYDRTRHTFVAIRELASPALLARFERELELAKVLTHENIVVIHDHGQSRDTRYLTTEYLEGDSLDGLLKSGELSFERALDLVITACQALEYVHVRGVVHRDVKPASMFVTSEGVLKLMHFGSALSEGQELDPGAPGSSGYTAPEQLISPSTVTPRADVWSLGAIAYQLFTGVLPYPKLDEREAAREGRLPAAPSSVNARVPAELDAVILRALAGRPEDRQADAGELCERLMALRRKHVAQPAATTPITSVRPGAPAQRPGRKLVLPAAAAVALLGVGALLLRGGDAEQTANDAVAEQPAVAATPSVAQPPAVAATPAAAATPAVARPPTDVTPPSTRPSDSTPPRALLAAPRCPAGYEPVAGRELQLAQPRPRAWAFSEHTLPAHPLDGFCIEARPVSVAAYSRCVEEGRCTPHEQPCTPSSEPGAPMHCVSWQAAQKYCAARGGELPSVAQWEAYALAPSARTSSSEWAQDSFPPAVFGARCNQDNPARCDGHLFRRAGRLPIVAPDGRGRLAFSWNRGASTSASGYDYVSFRCALPAPSH